MIQSLLGRIGRGRRLQEMRSACELALSHLDFRATVHVAEIAHSSAAVRLLVMLDTPDKVEPAALLSLRGYLASAIRSTTYVPLDPEQVVVCAQDFAQAKCVAERVSREDVLAGRLRRSVSAAGDSEVGSSLS